MSVLEYVRNLNDAELFVNCLDYQVRPSRVTRRNRNFLELRLITAIITERAKHRAHQNLLQYGNFKSFKLPTVERPVPLPKKMPQGRIFPNITLPPPRHPPLSEMNSQRQSQVVYRYPAGVDSGNVDYCAVDPHPLVEYEVQVEHRINPSATTLQQRPTAIESELAHSSIPNKTVRIKVAAPSVHSFWSCQTSCFNDFDTVEVVKEELPRCEANLKRTSCMNMWHHPMHKPLDNDSAQQAKLFNLAPAHATEREIEMERELCTVNYLTEEQHQQLLAEKSTQLEHKELLELLNRSALFNVSDDSDEEDDVVFNQRHRPQFWCFICKLLWSNGLGKLDSDKVRYAFMFCATASALFAAYKFLH